MRNTKIRSVVFDLDGTLMKSDATIYKATLKALKVFNIETVVPEIEFVSRIGYHFKDIFEHLQITVSDMDMFIETYRTFYFDHIEDTIIYPNILETLSTLRENNIMISLLTTKMQEQADLIIDYFDLAKYFTIVFGRRKGIPIKPAPDQLFGICRETGIPPEETIMVGDSELDIQCGKNAGTKTCAVTYGYGAMEILQTNTPDHLISDIRELLHILNKQ